MSQQRNLTYSVTRQDTELITPAKTTPNGLKYLSDMDDVLGLHFHVIFIQIYRSCNNANGKDPVKVIKEAISHALVHFYPLAGRLRKIVTNRKAVVDCTGEGVVFVEADADVCIDEFGKDLIHTPFPGVEKLIPDLSQSLYDSPVLHFQVTRFNCGGFVVATGFNHIMFDGYGISQFMSAVSDLARGLPTPYIQPVWNRHLLTAREPPQVTFKHHQYNFNPSDKQELTPELVKEAKSKIQKVFLFDKEIISSLRELVAQDMHAHCTTFDLIASTMWRAWIMSKKLDPTTEVPMRFNVNARTKFNPPIEQGYYGNVVTMITAGCTAGELKSNSVGHAAQLIQKAKKQVTEEYMRSMIDLLSLNKGLPYNWGSTSFTVTDIRHLGIEDTDYGWGKPVYAGGPNWDLSAMSSGILTCFQTVRNNKGEDIGTMVPITLHETEMDSFIDKMNLMTSSVANNREWNKDGNTLLRWAKKLLK